MKRKINKKFKTRYRTAYLCTEQFTYVQNSLPMHRTVYLCTEQFTNV